MKYWVLPDIENRIKEGSIKAYFGYHIGEIRDQEIDIVSPEGKVTIPNDFVLAMTGYQPNFTFLEKLGVAIGHDIYNTPVYNPETMETNVPNVFLGGCDLWRTQNQYLVYRKLACACRDHHENLNAERLIKYYFYRVNPYSMKGVYNFVLS